MRPLVCSDEGDMHAQAPGMHFFLVLPLDALDAAIVAIIASHSSKYSGKFETENFGAGFRKIKNC